MMSDAEYATGTFYRYTSINLTRFAELIGSIDDALRVVDIYLRAFCTAMPTGKQSTTGAVTPADLALSTSVTSIRATWAWDGPRSGGQASWPSASPHRPSPCPNPGWSTGC